MSRSDWIRTATALLVAGLLATATGCSDAAHEACVRFCSDCPDGQVIQSNTDCESWCDGWEELSDLAACDDQFEQNWECWDELEGCDTGSCFEDSFEDCVEAYCRASDENDAECEEVAEEHGWG